MFTPTNNERVLFTGFDAMEKKMNAAPTVHQHATTPSTLPSWDLPSSLSLPLLAPRAKDLQHAEAGDATSNANAGTALADIVSLMSLRDMGNAFANSNTMSCNRPPTSDRFAPTAALPVFNFTLAMKPRSRDNDDEDDDEEKDDDDLTCRSSVSSHVPPPLYSSNAAQWTLTTPETIKTTIFSTPQGVRLPSQKRKSPDLLVHATPVHGSNLPLMLPSLSSHCSTGHGGPCNYFASAHHNAGRQTDSSFTASSSSHHDQQTSGRSHKRIKSSRSLLNDAPMLPMSPDLEDRMLFPASRFPNGYGIPHAAPQSLVATPSHSSSSSHCSGRPPVAALPSLEEEEEGHPKPRTAPNKWLRMKRRQSLLCALRLSVSDS